MRHGDKINNLGRTTAHRKALLSNLACQLIEHKRINTTLAKAKSLRTYVEPLITKAKNDTVHNRRLVFSKLQDKEAIKELFGAVSNKVADRPGGYTRIIKLQARMGDAADMAMIELVDFNTIYQKDTKAGAAKKTRRSRGSAKAKTTAAPVAAEAPVADDLAKVEGIGPKVAELFAQSGLTTFAALAAASAEDLKAILDAEGGVYSAMDPTSWPQQAQLAAEGKWDELQTLQNELKGGRAE
ncbi:MAG TPA: 50S ribosomal protein L17 [Flavobacteriaceae bacterium]|nr:50S ribosomal protein L17 [Flavobacteriaceae bacterium]